MKTHFFPLLLVVVLFSSFTKPTFENIICFNLTKIDTAAQEKLLAYKVQRVDTTKRYRLPDVGQYPKKKIEDSGVVALVKSWANKFDDNSGLLKEDGFVSIDVLGDMTITKDVTTRLVYIEADMHDNPRLRSIFGVNIVNGQIISVMELAKSRGAVGWGGYFSRSIRRGKKFHVLHDFGRCVIGEGVRYDPPEVERIKVGNDGRVKQSYQHDTKYVPIF